MQELNNNIDDLLVKYLLDEASPDERTTVDTWLAANVDNKRYFDHFRLIWEQSKNLAANSTVDTDAAWQRFQLRVKEAETNRPAAIPLKPRYGFRIAASLVFMISLAGLIYLLSGRSGMQELVSNEEVISATLPDGSVVTLNKHAHLSYPSDFKGNQRHVSLEGEAFFNITPDKQKPFIIAANGVRVKVVGTSFNVKSSADSTEVIVETGIVEVSKQAASVMLKPHEQALIRKDDVQLKKRETTDLLYNYYRTRKFECNDIPLSRLVDVLREVYKADIVFADEQLKNLPLSTTFDDDTLDEVLKTACGTHNLTYEQRDGRYIIKSR